MAIRTHLKANLPWVIFLTKDWDNLRHLGIILTSKGYYALKVNGMTLCRAFRRRLFPISFCAKKGFLFKNFIQVHQFCLKFGHNSDYRGILLAKITQVSNQRLQRTVICSNMMKYFVNLLFLLIQMITTRTATKSSAATTTIIIIIVLLSFEFSITTGVDYPKKWT